MSTTASATGTPHLTVRREIAPVLSATVASFSTVDLDRILRDSGIDVRNAVLHQGDAPNICRWEGRDSDGLPVRGAVALRVEHSAGRVQIVADVYLRDGRIHHVRRAVPG